VTLEKGRVLRLQEGAVELEDRSLPFDACLWAGGFSVPAVVRQSGLPVNARGQVLVDAYLRAIGHENIHVIGDAAAPVELPSAVLMGCKTAMPMGTHVAESLAQVSRGELPEPFDYLDTVYCVSLGRRDGLVQPIRQDGSPSRWVVGGRLGAWIKETICRGVIATLRAERAGLSLYRWRRSGRKLSPGASRERTLAA
jgi:NADH dehydrogenase